MCCYTPKTCQEKPVTKPAFLFSPAIEIFIDDIY